MLGRFLEFSAPTTDIRDSLAFYEKLGFTQAEVGAVWAHPYAVVTDGRIHVGLHQDGTAVPALTFVKPGLLAHLDVLERLGVGLLYRRLGNDVFNEAAWLDPSGHMIRLVEARTFSPGKRSARQQSLCGYFAEIALPADSLADAKAYWESLGFVGLDEPGAPLPHVSCTSDTIDVGLYDAQHLGRPALEFETENLAARVADLAEKGIEPAGGMPQTWRDVPLAAYLAPEGTQILLLAAG